MQASQNDCFNQCYETREKMVISAQLKYKFVSLIHI